MAVPAYNRNENRLEVLNKLDEIQNRIARICISHPLFATNQNYNLLKDNLLQASIDLSTQISYANSLSLKNKQSTKMRLEAQYEGRKYMYRLIIVLQMILRLEDCINTEAFEDVLAIINGEFKTIFYGWTAKTLQVVKSSNSIDSKSINGIEQDEIDDCASKLLAQVIDDNE